jgi:hypothetical protein
VQENEKTEDENENNNEEETTSVETTTTNALPLSNKFSKLNSPLRMVHIPLYIS